MKRLLLTVALFAVLMGSAFGQGSPISTNTWTAITPTGWPVLSVGYDKLVYVDSLHQACWWGTYKLFFTGASEEDFALNCYSYSENRFHLMQHNPNWHSSHGIGAGHSVSMFAYDSDDDVIALQSDGSGPLTPERFHGRWEWFDFGGLQGRDKSFSPRPWLDNGSTPLSVMMVYDSTDKKFLIVDYSNKIEACSPSTNTCSTVATSGATLPAWDNNSSPNMVYDSTNNTTYLWGGLQANMYAFQCATAACTTGTITQLTTTCTGAACVGTAPAARLGAGMAYSSADNIILMMGGATVYNNPAGTAYLETWKFDPATNAWTQLTVSGSYPNTNTSISFDKLTYDAYDNVFLYLRIGTNFAPTVYAFAYSAGLNYGRTSTSYSPTAGYLNQATSSSSNQSSAFKPSLAYNGSILYESHVETGLPSDATNCGSNSVAYAQSLSGAAWTQLPTFGSGSCAALNNVASGNVNVISSYVAYVNGTLWETHDMMSSSTMTRTYAGTWNGSTWSMSQIGCFSGTCSGAIAQRPTGLIAVGTTPTVGLIEWDSSTFQPLVGHGYVAQYSGGTWSTVGGVLNTQGNGSGDEVQDIAIGSNGSQPFACFTEQVRSTRTTNTLTPQVYCSYWSGAAWTALGSSINQSATDWASDPAVTYFNSTYYVAWAERTVGGNNLVYVARWNGFSWVVLGGGSINLNTSTGWGAHPSLANDGTNLYVAWEEQSTLGQKSKGYVKKWDGATWTQLGGALNADATNGSVSDITLVYQNSQPRAVWSEMKLGNLQQIYGKQYNNPGGWVAFGTAYSDTCSIAAPVDGAVLNGTTNVTAAATPGQGAMNSLQLTLDGANLGPDLGGSGSYSWNTTLTVNGTHTLSCTCSDTGGGSGSCANVTVTLSNPPTRFRSVGHKLTGGTRSVH